MFFFQVFHFLSPSLFLSAAFSFGRFICLSFFHHHPPSPPPPPPFIFPLFHLTLFVSLSFLVFSFGLLGVSDVQWSHDGHGFGVQSPSRFTHNPSCQDVQMSRYRENGKGGGGLHSWFKYQLSSQFETGKNEQLRRQRLEKEREGGRITGWMK